jgi:predicted aldo/keto reductase-like oxidoreductase
LTPLNDEYLIESGSDIGSKLINLIEGRNTTPEDFSKKYIILQETNKQFKRYINTDNLPEIFEKNINHKIWQRLGDIDLACGQCVNSCPTCYCFDIRDKLSISTNECTRFKEWDACFLLEFSEVALGGNFRRDRSARVRQFMGHNLGWGGTSQYTNSEIKFKCVGCGRCIQTCPVHIDITQVVAELRGEKNGKSL